MLSRLRPPRRRASVALLTLVVIVCASATAFAQLDPLLFVKRVPPTVIVVFDTSLRMLDDGAGNVYDPSFYSTTADAPVMGRSRTSTRARRKRTGASTRNFQYDSMLGGRYVADSITAVPAVWDPANALTSNAAGRHRLHGSDQIRHREERPRGGCDRQFQQLHALGPRQAAPGQRRNGASRRTATSPCASPTRRRSTSATRRPATAGPRSSASTRRASARRTRRSSCRSARPWFSRPTTRPPAC